MIDRKRAWRAKLYNSQPLNQAALKQLRRLKEPDSAGIPHVLSLMRWWLEQHGATLGPERDGVAERLYRLMETEPEQVMRLLQDPEETGDQALDPEALKKAAPEDAGWLLVDALLSAMQATSDPLQSN